MAMPTQSTYQIEFNGAFAGMLNDEPDARVESGRNDAGANIPAGIFMAQGTSQQSAILPAAASGAGAKLIGAVVNTFYRNPGDVGSTLSGASDAYLPGVSIPLLTRGEIWIVSESAFAMGDDVYVRYQANGGLTQLGAVTSGAGTTTGCRKLTGARVMIPSTAAGVVLLAVNVDVDRATV